MKIKRVRDDRLRRHDTDHRQANQRESRDAWVKIFAAAALFCALWVPAMGPAAAADPVLKVGSTPTGIPFTFLDTRRPTRSPASWSI